MSYHLDYEPFIFLGTNLNIAHCLGACPAILGHLVLNAERGSLVKYVTARPHTLAKAQYGTSQLPLPIYVFFLWSMPWQACPVLM